MSTPAQASRSLLQRFAQRLFGEYTAFFVLSRRLDESASDESLTDCSVVSDSAANADAVQGSCSFALVQQGRRVAMCTVWYGKRYESRNYWPLQHDECKLIGLETDEDVRGRGLGPRLIRFASLQMRQRGFRRMYARVWHSNKSSLRAFAKAGWVRHALVFDVFPAGRHLRWVLRLARTRAGAR